jgi:hypothetical protein
MFLDCLRILIFNTLMTMTTRALPIKRGRPIGGLYTPVTVRVREPLNSRLNEWIDRQIDRPTRPEAMRRLTAQALAAFDSKAP